jgi:DNA-binding CsgD family transcriptional regulator
MGREKVARRKRACVFCSNESREFRAAVGMLGQTTGNSQIGNVAALVRTARSAGALVDGNDAAQRKRRLVASFCKMLGEQLVEGKPAPVIDPPLSPRERQTLELLLNGDAEKQIANRLSLSKHTVHVYVKSLYKRFDVCSRGELLAKWVQR